MANCGIASVLSALPKFAINLAPCVADPDNAANVCAFCPTRLVKSSNGSAAVAAVCLSSTMLCPNVAPIWESCLKVSC